MTDPAWPDEIRLIGVYPGHDIAEATSVPVGDDPEGRPIVVWFCSDGTVRCEHYCSEIDPGRWVVTAPHLQLDTGRHVVVSREPLTITPSILCADCGLHGFVTDGRWQDVGRGPARFPRPTEPARSTS